MANDFLVPTFSNQEMLSKKDHFIHSIGAPVPRIETLAVSKNASPPNNMTKHEFQRMRFDVVRRQIIVSAVDRLTPGMLRITFHSNDLAGFQSPSPDDHIKIIFPTDGGETVMRDFTPRAFDVERGTLTIDFAVHSGGPAIDWAMSACIGSQLTIGGPKGSLVVPDDFDWYLLIGDESALPSIGRRVEALRPGVPVSTMVVISDPTDIQHFRTGADWKANWIIRGETDEGEMHQMQSVLRSSTDPDGEGFVWIAGETDFARSMYRFVTAERGHPREWVKASGYWTRGKADCHENIGA
jgi:NADPH-dependent ferric siderophore reductase